MHLWDASAFSPTAPMVLGANLRTTANIPRTRQIRAAMQPALRMAGEQPEQVIDFGKVGFAEADNQVCTLPALSSGHTSAKAHCPLPVGESQFSFVGSFQSSEPPWQRAIFCMESFPRQTRQSQPAQYTLTSSLHRGSALHCQALSSCCVVCVHTIKCFCRVLSLVAALLSLFVFNSVAALLEPLRTYILTHIYA